MNGDFIQPERIVRGLDIKEGMRVADFGSGSGHFTILFAEKVGDSGKVTAFDVQKDTLEVVRSRAKTKNLLNVEAVWADLERPRGTGLDDESQDWVLVANVLFQAEDKKAILQEAMRVLRPGGSFLLIEWDESEPPPGPPKAYRIGKQRARELCESIGFSLFRDIEAGTHHYGFLFKK